MVGGSKVGYPTGRSVPKTGAVTHDRRRVIEWIGLIVNRKLIDRGRTFSLPLLFLFLLLQLKIMTRCQNLRTILSLP